MEWRNNVHNQAIAARVSEALAIAMKVARDLPYEVRRDVAQETVVEQADHLFNDDWQEAVAFKAQELLCDEKKRYEKEKKGLEKYKEHIMNRQRGSEKNRLWLRELAADATTPRQWQVLQRKYWRGLNGEQIGREIGCSRENVRQIHDAAMQNLREALRRFDINKSNWRAWYYEQSNG